MKWSYIFVFMLTSLMGHDLFAKRKLKKKEQRELALSVRTQALEKGFTPMPAPPKVRKSLVRLGKALVFDKELSGNRDIACMTCHLPQFGTADGRHLSMGQGGQGIGPERVGGPLIPRNAPPLFNMHVLDTLFWDGRVSVKNGVISSPAGNQITEDMKKVFEFGAISVLPLFPVTSREEMRGFDVTENELAAVDDNNFTLIWQRIMKRLGRIPKYRRMFQKAYPGTKFSEMNAAHFANAIGGFFVAKLATLRSPWDRFLKGRLRALSDKQLAGANVFLNAPCSQCHTGNDQSDDKFHNVVLAQFGPGAGDGPYGNDDFGHEKVTGLESDRYKFRTTPLRMVEITGPFGHAGQFVDLADFIFHYSEQDIKLRNYDTSQLPANLANTLVDNTEEIIDRTSPIIKGVVFTRENAELLAEFMTAFTDARFCDLNRLVPRSVPSGSSLDEFRGMTNGCSKQRYK